MYFFFYIVPLLLRGDTHLFEVIQSFLDTSRNLKPLKYFLLFLIADSTPKHQAKSILKNISPHQVQIVSEILLNFLHGVIPLQKAKVKKLAIYKKKY